MRIQDHEIPQSDSFCYLGSIISKDGEIDEDVKHRIKAGWLKWRLSSGVLCDRRITPRLKGKFNKTLIRPAMISREKYFFFLILAFVEQALHYKTAILKPKTKEEANTTKNNSSYHDHPRKEITEERGSKTS